MLNKQIIDISNYILPRIFSILNFFCLPFYRFSGNSELGSHRNRCSAYQKHIHGSTTQPPEDCFFDDAPTLAPVDHDPAPVDLKLHQLPVPEKSWRETITEQHN